MQELTVKHRDNLPDPYFTNIPTIGNLSMDWVLVEYDYILLSVLKDTHDNKYLCVCYDTRGSQQWLITPVSIKHLMELFLNKRDVASVFKNRTTKIMATLDYETRQETFELVEPDLVPAEAYPEDGIYLDATEADWRYMVYTRNSRNSWENSPEKRLWCSKLPLPQSFSKILDQISEQMMREYAKEDTEDGECI